MNDASSLVHLLERHAERTPNEPALLDRVDGSWDAVSWRSYLEQAREVGAGLAALGVEPGDAVVLMGPNRRDWAIAQLGIWTLGGRACPIYATSTDGQTRHIVQNAEAEVAIVGDAASADKLRRAGIESIVTMDPSPGADSLEALRARGREHGMAKVDAASRASGPDTVAMLIYTSGTTGQPKGVQIDHGNMLAVVGGVTDVLPNIAETPDGWVLLSYLPLSHVAEQMFTIMGHLLYGGQVYFCDDLDKLKTYLPEVRPTVFVGVPRVWEKFQAALEAGLAGATGIKKRLADWALRTELAGFRRDMSTGGTEVGLGRRWARKLVVDKIKTRLGLDRVVFACVGAAPTSPQTMEFFASLGIVLHEGFGMTETAGAVTSNPYGRPRFGTVGQAIPGVEIRIAEDGEILMRGRAMTRGYNHDPEATSELLDDDGWLHTGDLGSLDADGFLSITGRKKELIITAGGKNVAPVEIEARLNAIPGVGQSVVMGDRQPYLTALLMLDPEALPALSRDLQVETESVDDLALSPSLRAHFEKGIEEINRGLAQYQTIKRFHVVPRELSVDMGELTPTMKLRRAVIAQNFQAEVAAMYQRQPAQRPVA